jgi:hypothetical protein
MVIAPLKNNRLNIINSFLRRPEAAAMSLGLCIPHNRHEQCKPVNHHSMIVVEWTVLLAYNAMHLAHAVLPSQPRHSR